MMLMAIRIDKGSLEVAISEFNDWNKGARLCLDIEDGCFETSVYHNDVMMSETFSTDNFKTVYVKTEIEGNITIGKKRKEYIIKLSELLLDGWESYQAQYELAEYYV